MSFVVFFYFLLQLLAEYWPFVAVIGLTIAAWIFGGRTLATITGVIGTVIFVYLRGRRDEKQAYAEAVRRIQAKREKAYAEIEARHTGASDVADRLRKHDF